MPKARERFINIFNRIFRRNNISRIANVTKQNYDEYFKTYNTLFKIFSKLEGIDAYLIGGISAAIQTKQDLYRNHDDIDIMCKEEQLTRLLETLKSIGYSIEDRRGIHTRNKRNMDGTFQPVDHELNADTKKKDMLGVGIFTYKIKGNEVICHSYAFEEKEGRVVGTEKVMPKELFDLMYESKVVDYKGIKLKTQSKEYIYMSKSMLDREKDKLDTSVIRPSLGDKSKLKIARIRELQAKTKNYKVVYDKDGKILSKTRIPTLAEKTFAYLDSLYMQSTTKTSEQIVADVLQSEEYSRLISEHPELRKLLANWEDKAKNYTYENKISLLTTSYSKKLEEYSGESIENVLDFIKQRQINEGRADKDISLSDEAKDIFKLMQEYEDSIKKVFVDNNICLTHITEVAPDELENGKLRKSINRPNNYLTERVDAVFASSTPIDGKNLYIARNGYGMVRLAESTYIYGNDNINVVQDSEGKKHAMLKQPNYIYKINPAKFKPVCNLTLDHDTHKPVFEFSEEWIADTSIDISDKTQVLGIDKVENVTSILYNYTILCDTYSQNIGRTARQARNSEQGLKYILEKINDGSVRNINHETGINDRKLSLDER